MPHAFSISINVGYSTKHIRVEHFRLHGNTVITLESSRPLFRNKGIKHRKPDYKLIDGKVRYSNSLDPFIEKINEHSKTHIPVKFKLNGKDLNWILYHGTR